MNDAEDLREEYLGLRERSESALLATLDAQGLPVASYAPLIWWQGRAYLFLSELAEHTRNLKRCASLSLLLVDDVDHGGNAFVRRRITLQARAYTVARDDVRFEEALVEFRRRFGDVIDLLRSLPDFYLFELQLVGGRYIRGFGQAYELSGERLEQLIHIRPGLREDDMPT